MARKENVLREMLRDGTSKAFKDDAGKSLLEDQAVDAIIRLTTGLGASALILDPAAPGRARARATRDAIPLRAFSQDHLSLATGEGP